MADSDITTENKDSKRSLQSRDSRKKIGYERFDLILSPAAAKRVRYIARKRGIEFKKTDMIETLINEEYNRARNTAGYYDFYKKTNKPTTGE